MKKPHSLFVGVVILFLCFKGGISRSQENAPRTMSAKSFETWCNNLQGRGENITHKSQVPAAQQELMTAQDILLDRLRQDKWTSDEAILTLLSAWEATESPKHEDFIQAGGITPPASYPHTVAYIHTVVALLSGRNLLQAKLYEQQGAFFKLMRQDDAALRAYQKSLDLVTPVSLRSELNRMHDKVEIAEVLEKRGTPQDKQEADKLYFAVYTYKWYLVPDRTVVEGLKGLYIQAGVGLINLRRGNEQKLTILKNLLIPSAEASLQPELDEAIKAAHTGTP